MKEKFLKGAIAFLSVVILILSCCVLYRVNQIVSERNLYHALNDIHPNRNDLLIAMYKEFKDLKSPSPLPPSRARAAVKTEKRVIRSSLSGFTKREIIDWLDNRYGVAKNPKPLVHTVFTDNKTPLDRKKLEATLRATYQRMPNIRSTDDFIKLMIETTEVETYRGGFMKNTVSSAQGIFQIMGFMERDSLKFYKNHYPDIYHAIMQFYDHSKSPEWNRIHNIPYGAALVGSYYVRVNPNLYNRIDTLEKRAYIWKLSYNTDLDPAGSEALYIKMVKKLEKHDREMAEESKKKEKKA